jgi:hypothetical protein
VRIERSASERGREGPGRALRRGDVPERRGRPPREEIQVGEADDEEDERGDGCREEALHRKTGSFL